MDKGARNFIVDNMLAMTAYWLCSGSVVAGLTSYYNLPLALSNLITGFTSTLLILQLLGGVAFARCATQFRFVRFTNTVWRICLPLAFLSVLLPQGIGALTMVVTYFLGIGLYQFACPSQTDWMVNSVEGKVQSNYFSVREMCFMLLYTAAFCAVSLVMDYANNTNTQRMGFIIVGLIAAILLGSSLFPLFRLPAPVRTATAALPLRKMFSVPFSNKAFMPVFITNLMWSFASMFIDGFSAVYQIRILEISFATIMVWVTAGNLVRSVATPFMAKLAVRIGWRNVLTACFLIKCATAIGWLCTTRENLWVMFPILSIFGALPYAGMGVAFLQLQVATTQPAQRSIYFSVNATCNGLASFCGSLVCSWLIAVLETSFGITALSNVFLLGFIVCLAAALHSLRITAPEVLKA